VALKRLLPQVAADPEVRALFAREIEALGRISHPNVVAILAHGEDRGLPWLAMALAEGASLRQILGPRRCQADPRRRLPVATALWLGSQVALGLAAAHDSGVVHRDVSPTNLQVLQGGDVQIVDFGIARIVGAAGLAGRRRLRGKLAYLSPEQIEGEAITGQADLFGLGSVLVELLDGSPPFVGGDAEETLGLVRQAAFGGLGLRSLVDPFGRNLAAGEDEASCGPLDLEALDRLLASLLSRDPAARPPGGNAVASALSELLAAADLADLGLHRALLAARVAALTAPDGPVPAAAAEIRGEEVTDPAGEGVTGVRY
jgi:serine/threonine-protein kinase